MPLSSRTGFNSSQLVRLLADQRIGDGVDPRQTIAERLSQWVAWTDAIRLSDALSGATTALPDGPAAAAVVEQVDRTRAELARDVATDTLFGDAAAGIDRSSEAAGEAGDLPACRRQYQAHQQAMEMRVGSLRARVRSALAARSAPLGRLAALDAALEQALGGRERQLLASIPLLLETRFAGARTSPAAAAAATDSSAADERPAAFRLTLRSVLLAELELRMQPVEAMVEALAEAAAAQP